jgi:transcriptional regulator with XRE-family HTH domain
MESHVMVKRQPLPDSSGDAEQLLVERLRSLKQRTGLSLAALATATPFSKSTWHRYLNGDQFPPRTAVDALGRLADTDPGPLLDLWDAAARAQSSAASAPQQPPGPEASTPEGARRPRRGNRAFVALAAVAATVAVTAGAADVLDFDEAPAPRAAASCRGSGCQGEFPTAETCGRDARTESSVAKAAQVVLLRFSPSCATVWSEVRTRAGGAREISIRSGQDELSATYEGDKSDGYTSPMLAASSPRGAQACAKVGGKPACTGLFGVPRP